MHSKNKTEDIALLKRSKIDIKKVDQMINHAMYLWEHVTATVREFMFCKVRVQKAYFCNWLRKNWPTLIKFPPLNYHKILNPPFLFPLLEFQNKKSPHYHVLSEILVPLPFMKGGGYIWVISIYLKLVFAIFYQFFIFSPNDSPFKTKKNSFYLIKKALFVLEIFKFL